MAETLFPIIHPALLDLGFIQLRWYSLMYILGFGLGYWILVRLARARFLPMPVEKIGDLIFWLILGVMLGGRIGYVVFYYLVHGHWEYIANPLRLIAVWEGGLSFHGGLLGVVVVVVAYTRKLGFPTLRVGDAMAMAATPGIFAVRMANFINGELYGRVADASVPWAMRFPTDPLALGLMGVRPGLGLRDRERAMLEKIEAGEWDRILADPVLRDKVPLRHPSQIYEALAEGLLVGLVLWITYRLSRTRPLGSGVYLGILLLGYGVGRFAVEQWRKPDDHLGTVAAGFSMGQVLCAAMMVAGGLLIACQWNRREPLAPVPDDPASDADSQGSNSE